VIPVIKEAITVANDIGPPMPSVTLPGTRADLTRSTRGSQAVDTEPELR
jgi:hypothetical protein